MGNSPVSKLRRLGQMQNVRQNQASLKEKSGGSFPSLGSVPYSRSYSPRWNDKYAGGRRFWTIWPLVLGRAAPAQEVKGWGEAE